jgi:GTP-binding protein Era
MKEESGKHRSGFVNILGRPNVGKSTLMNSLVGEKISIITSKAQTTRHRIHGIVNGEDFQIVYSDTPGLLNPRYKLQENMLKAARSALEDADIILYMTEINEEPSEEMPFINKIKHTEVPTLLVMNKVDLGSEDKLSELQARWEEILPNAEFIAVSALLNFNIENLFKSIYEKLPEGPPYYPKEDLTDKSERFFVGEIIREKILLNYKQEIPYAVEIEVEEFKESEDIIRIRSIIYVERDSQKGIIIGNAGKAIKKTGIDSRKDIEDFFGKKVFLELFVKVKKDWRNNDNMLRQFGYH